MDKIINLLKNSDQNIIINSKYLEYEENANRISSIATVFPTIFFLIAALVSLTTMGRMIEEKRTEGDMAISRSTGAVRNGDAATSTV